MHPGTRIAFDMASRGCHRGGCLSSAPRTTIEGRLAGLKPTDSVQVALAGGSEQVAAALLGAIEIEQPGLDGGHDPEQPPLAFEQGQAGQRAVMSAGPIEHRPVRPSIGEALLSPRSGSVKRTRRCRVASSATSTATLYYATGLVATHSRTD